MLNDHQVRQYQQNGWVSPIDIYDAGEIADIRGELEKAENNWPDALSGPGRNNAHLVLPVLDRIAHEPRILDAVEQLIGHDILITSTTLFIKDPHTKGYVSWHQDARYVGLEPHNWVTAWLAITDVNEENGCMYMLPGSHEQPLVDHDDTYGEDNILTRGQTIHGVDEASTVPVLLKAGQLSLHHPRVIHGSGANSSSRRRIGFAIQSYVGGDVEQVFGDVLVQQARGSVSKISGRVDRPQASMSDTAISQWHAANDALSAVFYEGAEKKGKY